MIPDTARRRLEEELAAGAPAVLVHCDACGPYRTTVLEPPLEACPFCTTRSGGDAPTVRIVRTIAPVARAA